MFGESLCSVALRRARHSGTIDPGTARNALAPGYLLSRLRRTLMELISKRVACAIRN